MSLTRQQFQDQLNFNFDSLLFPIPDTLKGLITNDKNKMNIYLTNILRAQGKVNDYLAQWDAAPDQAAKDAVVAGVVYDLGNATVDPESAVLWPDSGGRWGSIKGPSSAVQGHLAVFASTTGQLAADGGSASNRSQSSVSRSFNSPFQISVTNDALVNYSVDIACTLSLTTGQTGTVFLEICNNSSFSSGVQELCRFVNGNTGTLTIGLNLSQNVTGGLNGYVPSGYWARIRTANTTGTPTFTYRSGQEVLL